MKSIGLIGWYWDGNLGDVLMAWMHVRVLSEQGYRVRVLRLPEPFAREHGMEVVQDPVELVEGADAVVYGGGGLFTRIHRDRRETGPFGNDCETVLAESERRKTPILLCSVGGDGEDLGQWRPWQEGFLRQARAISVRNHADAEWIRRRGVACDWHADVVWQTPEFLPPVGRDGRALGALLQWPPSGIRGPLAAISRIGEALGTMRRFHGIWREWARDSGAGVCYSRSLAEDTDLIRGSRCVLSARLHMGMLALAYGVPYLPFMPVPKTELMLAEAGWKGPIVRSKPHALLQLAKVAFLGAGRGVGGVLSAAQRNELSASAGGHWKWLLGQLKALEGIR